MQPAAGGGGGGLQLGGGGLKLNTGDHEPLINVHPTTQSYSAPTLFAHILKKSANYSLICVSVW